MSSIQPKFIDSPYFVDEPGNWHLKEGAPEDVVKEFEDFMQNDEAGEPEEVPVLRAKDLNL